MKYFIPYFFLFQNVANCFDDTCEKEPLPVLADPDATENCAVCLPTNSALCGLYLDCFGTHPITDFSQAGLTDWGAASVNNSDPGDFVRYLEVIDGNIPDYESTTQRLPKKKTVELNKTYTLTADVVCVNDFVYAFGQSIQKNGYTGYLHYESLGCYFYGSGTGIKVSSTKASFIKGGGDDDVDIFRLVFTYELCQDPDRVINSLATA